MGDGGFTLKVAYHLNLVFQEHFIYKPCSSLHPTYGSKLLGFPDPIENAYR